MEEERVGALHFEPDVVLSRIVREQFVRHAFQLFALISGYVYFRGMRVGLELRVELTFPALGSLCPISFYNSETRISSERNEERKKEDVKE